MKPTTVNWKIFFLDENGATYVLEAGRNYKLMRINRLRNGDGICMATPAMAGGNLLIRTDTRLYCIGEK